MVAYTDVGAQAEYEQAGQLLQAQLQVFLPQGQGHLQAAHRFSLIWGVQLAAVEGQTCWV